MAEEKKPTTAADVAGYVCLWAFAWPLMIPLTIVNAIDKATKKGK